MALTISVDGLTTPLLSTLFIILLISLLTRPSSPLPVHPFLFGKQANFQKIRRKGESPVLSANSSGYYTSQSNESLPTSIRQILASYSAGNLSITGFTKDECDFKALAAGIRSAVSGWGNGKMIGIWTGEHEGGAHLLTLLASLILSPHSTNAAPIISLPPHPLPPSFPLSNLSNLCVLFLTPSTFSHFHTALSLAPINPPNQKPVVIWIGKAKGEENVKELERMGFKVLGIEELLEGGKGESLGIDEDEKIDAEGVVRLVVESNGNVIKQTHSNILLSSLALSSLYPTTPSASSSPLAQKPSASDRILSFCDPSSPYGLSVLLYSLASKASIMHCWGDMLKEDIWEALKAFRATVVFGPAGALHGLGFQLTNDTRIHHPILGNLALSLKISNLRKGHVMKDSFADQFVFQSVRKRTGTDGVRSVFVDGLVSQVLVDSLRSILGCPVVSILTHPDLPIPISASQFWDFQYHTGFSGATASKTNGDKIPELTHSGPPFRGVEIKLVEVTEVDEKEETKRKVMRGKLLAQSPLFPPLIAASSLSPTPPSLADLDYVDLGGTVTPTPGSLSPGGKEPEWFETGLEAEIRRNGTVRQIH